MKLSSHNHLFWIVFVFGILNVVESARKGRKSSRSATCSRGCIRCDEVNGCLQCRPRMFLYLSQNERRNFGICKHECPAGYYGPRGRARNNKCTKCEDPNCKSCFTINYCTECHSNFFLHDAKCGTVCPTDLIANQHTWKCENKVDCVVGSWSTWSKCARKSPSRSCKYGRKKRTRLIIQEPTENGTQCPKLRDNKKCKTPANECILINKWIQRLRKKNMRRRKGKGRGKKRNKRKKVEDNSTMPRLIEHNDKKNMTLTTGRTTER